MHELDKKILYLLGNEPAHTSKIARNLGILRTTVHYRLGKLKQSGTIKSTKVGQKTVWTLLFKNKHNKNHFRIYKGIEIIQAYKQLLNLPKFATILAVQGAEAVKHNFSALPDPFIKEIHKILKRKKIILRGIINEKALTVFSGLDTSILQSHVGRILSTKLFSNDNFLSSGEIMSTKKILLLANPRLKQAIIIKDKDIVMIIHDTLKLLFEMLDSTRTFDLNYYLRTKTSSK